ncbi:D-Ala-D-Ala carboxypeptidase family metallohydrolase [Aminobacter sp. AP02]|uniref:YcbK family protein n=1 Tax=Aminobacter sp. AP02 TaxID=2135737 RepID=UPI000D7A3157|nr:D-Ala-D-Ala carboxypeptidase family metallohydrolase [Aminobacter sp. AP02]PWK64650.1 peptidase M15-like protein [Aminobacter sp. AP02]
MPMSTATTVVAGVMICGLSVASLYASQAPEAHRPRGLQDLTPDFENKLEAAYTKQTDNVRINCFPAQLSAVLAILQRRFGKRPVVTSGYRPRSGGSMHAKCKAADIRIPGVKPGQIASYARSLHGIGGVGTYCTTGIVHVDVGPRRDWHYCSRAKKVASLRP